MVTNNAANNKTGASGKILQGQGVGTASDFSTATYPATATGTGKILRADGTNWVASTATYPDTAGTSGNVLTSDGTNWSSGASSGVGNLKIVSLNLTNSQCKNLTTTPITLITSWGSGVALFIVNWNVKMIYGGTNAFTGAATLQLLYPGSLNAASNITAGTWLTATANSVGVGWGNTALVSIASSSIENGFISILNAGSAIAGNAANNNTITVTAAYYLISV